MQAVLESRDIQDIAKQMQTNMLNGSQYDAKEKREAGIITSYEISKITGEANCKVSDKIRRLVPRGKEYYYDTIFTSKANSTFKALALTEKGLNIYIQGIEGQGNRCTKKQIEDIRKIREAMGYLSGMNEEAEEPVKVESASADRDEREEKSRKIREAVGNLVIADSFINVVEDRFIGRNYESLTYQERDDFERLFYFMADQLHSRIGELKAIVDGN